MERREARRERVVRAMGTVEADVALDLLELLEIAWHDCYGEISPAEQIVDDVLVLSEGRLDALVRNCRRAVTDWRDIRLAADARRST